MSDQPQADSVLQSIPFLLHWAKSYRGPSQNSKTWVQVTEVTRRRQSSDHGSHAVLAMTERLQFGWLTSGYILGVGRF